MDPETLPPPEPATVRIFLAVLPHPAVVGEMEQLASRLRKAAQFTPIKLSWVPPENYHVTLWFLGNVGRDVANRLAGGLPATAARVSSFQLDFRHLGFFPDDESRPPRVLWAGIHKPPREAEQLRNECAKLITSCGLPVPDQTFIPHVTLARLRSTRGLFPFRKVIHPYRFHKFGVSAIDRLMLMESITGGGPARYVPFAEAPLAPSREASP